MKIYQTPTVTLEFDPVKKQLIQKWTGFSSSEVFRTAIDKTVEFSKSNEVKSIISDTLEQAVVKPEDSEYASASMPKLIANGLKAMAFVMPKNIITKMALDKFDKDSKSELVGFFPTLVEAKQWVDKMVK
jgi:hypothetical protein